jgi:hypothetical protein
MNYLTVRELAERWRRAPKSIRRFLSSKVKAALVKARRINGRWLIPLEAVESYEDQRTIKDRRVA